MNSELYDKKIPIPQEVVEYLNKCFDSAKGASETTEGYKRNQELREKKEISYQQLKRIKNWFDSFNGMDSDLSFILNGGYYVKEWVNQCLNSMRDNVHSLKKNRSIALPNQFIQPHEKNNLKNMNRPAKSHHSHTNDFNVRVTESLKRINELINKII